MKNYNEKLFDATKNLSHRTLDKSMKKVYKLTHPSIRVSKIGSTIGTGIGVCLLVVGSIASMGGKRWGMGSCLAGFLTIASNAIKLKQNK